MLFIFRPMINGFFVYIITARFNTFIRKILIHKTIKNMKLNSDDVINVSIAHRTLFLTLKNTIYLINVTMSDENNFFQYL